jgi:hypothetical protein
VEGVVLNHANEPASVKLELAAGADFADLCEFVGGRVDRARVRAMRGHHRAHG